jgi:hypothetical protein
MAPPDTTTEQPAQGLNPAQGALIGLPPGYNPALGAQPGTLGQYGAAPGYPMQAQPGAVGAPGTGLYPGMPGQSMGGQAGGTPSSAPAGFFVGYSAPPPPTIPDYYTVEKGDTLWDISNEFFLDPWYWPKLWSLNPSITNPHWIFPGEVLRLIIEQAPQVQPGPAVSIFRAPPSEPALITQNAFIEGPTPPSAAVITGSEADKLLLGTGDIAYAQVDPQHPLTASTTPYPVYRLDHPVVDPDTGAQMGYLAKIVGTLAVDSVNSDGIARGMLSSTDVVERGDQVGPLPHAFEKVSPTRDDRDLEARVASGLDLRNLAGVGGGLDSLELSGAGQVVVLNRGSADGVKLGNRFLAFRQGDQYSKTLGPDRSTRVGLDPRYPKETRAELLVVWLAPHSAVAFVTDSRKEVEPGDYCDMRKGY